MMSTFVWLLMFISIGRASRQERDLTEEPGHLNRFGDGRPSQLVDEMDGFPPPEIFFHKYALKSKPLKMKGTAILSRGFHLWTDQHFLSLEQTEDEQVLIETKKKENRTQPPTSMTLREFVRVYNETDQYMVNSVPKYLRQNVLVPCPLQCDNVLGNQLIDAMMWFSSGGTKSVVHTDSVDNINCLFRGEKTLVMVDPMKYDHKVDLDHPEGSYSDIDVDAVDYVKYPGLADIEFYHVNMTAGDCLYIPYLWIHQVRSYRSNLAVNIWWDHYKFVELDPSFCLHECDTTLTIDKVKFHGFNAVMGSVGSIRDHMKQIIGVHDTLSEQQVVAKFLGAGEPNEAVGSGFKKVITQVVRYLDLNQDRNLSRQELVTADQEVWTKVKDKIGELKALRQAHEHMKLDKEEESEITDDSYVRYGNNNVVDDEGGEVKDEL